MSRVVQTVAEIAQHFGRSYRTISRWRRAGMPRLPGARGYDLAEIEFWLKTASHLGATFRQMEANEQVTALFESAVLQLRRGLGNLCLAFVKARGAGRTRLIDRALREILHGAARQQGLWEGEGGDPSPPCADFAKLGLKI